MCQFTVSFQPDAAGYREGGVVVIINTPQPITPVGFEGTGVPSLNGAATIAGGAVAGGTLTCNPGGFPDGTTYAYRWLANGEPIAGADTETLALSDTSVGERFSCSVLATNPVATETVTSPETAATVPMTLDRLPGSLIGEATCRVVQTAAALRAGPRTAAVSSGGPTTPWSPLTLTSTAPFRPTVELRPAGRAHDLERRHSDFRRKRRDHCQPADRYRIGHPRAPLRRPHRARWKGELQR